MTQPALFDISSKPYSFLSQIDEICSWLQSMDSDTAMEHINRIREKLHQVSPMKSEPVDFVRWVKTDKIQSNDYNPNKVAPVEMELLAHSILSDGYTQPVVTWDTGETIEVIDGFHRNRVCRENEEVRDRVKGYLPIVQIKQDREGRNDRIASTIRHNRARGKHQIESMSDIVVELKKRNWSDTRICKELGMDEDEVLRLCQITGLVEVFSNSEFSEAWEAELFSEDDFATLEEGDII